MEVKTPTQTEQTLTLKNRKELNISGIKKIISLKPELIQLSTCTGNLAITGNQLELLNLDNQNGNIEIIGNIDCLKFLANKNNGNLFRKIFK